MRCASRDLGLCDKQGKGTSFPLSAWAKFLNKTAKYNITSFYSNFKRHYFTGLGFAVPTRRCQCLEIACSEQQSGLVTVIELYLQLDNVIAFFQLLDLVYSYRQVYSPIVIEARVELITLQYFYRWRHVR